MAKAVSKEDQFIIFIFSIGPVNIIIIFLSWLSTWLNAPHFSLNLKTAWNDFITQVPVNCDWKLKDSGIYWLIYLCPMDNTTGDLMLIHWLVFFPVDYEGYPAFEQRG